MSTTAAAGDIQAVTIWGVFLRDGRFMDIASSDRQTAIDMAEAHYAPGEYELHALSAEGSANAAAARLAAEEMRERAAEAVERLAYEQEAQNEAKPHLVETHPEWKIYAWILRNAAAAIRALPLPPSSSPEDQEKAKAAATPTIADPVKEGGR